MDDNWVSRTLGKERFLIKSSFSSDSYELYLFDLSAIFVDTLEGSEIIERNVDLNPNVEVEIQRLVKLIKDSLKSNFIKVTHERDAICLESDMDVSGITFVWKFIAKKAEPKLLKDLMISPLLLMIFELLIREKDLTECILKKDAEIEDYKNHGAKVSRQYLETVKFDESTFFSDAKRGTLDLSTVLESIFNGPGKSLLKAVTERPWKAQSESVNLVKEVDLPISKVQKNNLSLTQKDLEMQRREDLEKIVSSVKRKKKKLKI